MEFHGARLPNKLYPPVYNYEVGSLHQQIHVNALSKTSESSDLVCTIYKVYLVKIWSYSLLILFMVIKELQVRHSIFPISWGQDWEDSSMIEFLLCLHEARL